MAKIATTAKKSKSDFLTALPFMGPALIGLFIFVLVPAARGIYLSFTEYNIFVPPVFNGIENYTRMFQDKFFWNALVVTLEYVVINIGVQTVVALFIAVLLHRYTRSTFVRGIVITPYLISNVIVALIWFWLTDYNLGLIDSVIDALGMEKVTFYSSELAMPTIALINVWRHMGYTALLIFAGLQAIPKDVYDAAAVDGAGEWKTFRSITLPLLRPVMAFVLVITITGSFQVFDTIAVTTKGGPIIATKVFSLWIAETAWDNMEFGYASAISVFLMVLLSVIALLQTKLLGANSSDLER